MPHYVFHTVILECKAATMADCLPWDNVCCAVGPGLLAGGAELKRGAKMGRSCGRRAQLEAERRCAHLGELLLLCGFCFLIVLWLVGFLVRGTSE